MIRVFSLIFNLSTSWKLIELILLLFWAESNSKASFYFFFLVKLTKKLMKHLTMEVRIMNSSFINSIVCNWWGVIMGIVCPCFYQIFTVSFLARKLVFSPTISRTFHCYRSSLIRRLVFKCRWPVIRTESSKNYIGFYCQGGVVCVRVSEYTNKTFTWIMF